MRGDCSKNTANERLADKRNLSNETDVKPRDLDTSESIKNSYSTRC